MYEYRYNITYYNIIPVLGIRSWILGSLQFTIHLINIYVHLLFLNVVSRLTCLVDKSSASVITMNRQPESNWVWHWLAAMEKMQVSQGL